MSITRPDPRPLAPASRAEIVSTRLVDRVAMAADASHYLLRPRGVATPRTPAEVAALMAEARSRREPLTFRSGGTSLSGQASTGGLLVDTRRHFRAVEVLDGGARVRCGPGATLRSVNQRLARFARRLGPDPASEIAATIGGVIANNASGMACGTTQNTYRTLESMVLVLASGTVVDTSRPDADAALRRDEPELWEGLAALRDRVRRDPASVATIERQFAMKNTMGYGVNALLDFDEPVSILERLVIGSEGTLGFVAEAVFQTVPVLPHAATSLLVLDTAGEATDALPMLLEHGARTIELLDAASLRVVQAYAEASPQLRALDIDRHTALLVELQSDDAADLDAQVAALTGAARGLGEPEFTRDPRLRADLWHLRKGLYTSVAGARPAGTTNLLEDVVVPVPELTATVTELSGLFAHFGYDDAVIFGHAKDGNLHFMINPRLADPRALDTYAAFTEDMVDVVLDHGGSLKAEHGTGRIMAPFVRRQYGDELYDVMREIKRLCDPEGVLNPGVLMDDDPRAHLRHLKSVPTLASPMAERTERVDAFESADRCVECGFCEPTCPSKDVTTTPRRRIALLRAMDAAEPAERAELEKAYGYEAVDTCAVDSLCTIACPVNIDTGKLMKTLRHDRLGGPAQAAGVRVAESWGSTVDVLRSALKVASVVPGPLKHGATAAARSVLPKDWIPVADSDLPGAGRAYAKDRRDTATGTPEVVLFSSCIGNLFAAEGDGPGASAAFVALCRTAGVGVRRVENRLCCATPWVSKGLTDGAAAMARQVVDGLWEATRGGELAVVSDASSCTHGLETLAEHLDEVDARRWERLRIVDAVSFVADEVLDRLPEHDRLGSLVLHPTCSTVHLGIDDDLVAVGRACADAVTVPDAWGCCGFAGDRGMLHPELTASATAAEAAEVRAGTFDAYASANRTCEMGMTRATGQPYRHVLEVLADLVG
ncbi:FAD-binding and (Fe-S)-binding domain-containing protein [Mariniluteicoccus flavus]